MNSLSVKNNITLTIALHAGFWIIHFLIRLYFAQYFYTFDTNRLLMEIIYLPLRIGITYFTIYILIFQYLTQRKFAKFFIFLLLSFITVLLARRFMQFYLLRPIGLDNYNFETIFWDPLRILHRVIYIYPVVGIASIIALIKNWYDEQKLRFELTKEKLEAELKFLKAQIHPHFLFNTINNIYSLALDKSDKTADTLLKLSDLLNYMIYESDVREVPLKKEIDILNDYIELEKIRYGKKLDFKFEIKGDLQNKKIAPLLLLPITENCFKHGAGESVDSSFIHLLLECEKNNLFFKTINSKSGFNNSEKGIGLENLKKRLNLIYKEEAELYIDESQNEFKVTLKIIL